MIFPQDFESKIGFSSVRALLIEKCESKLGKDLAIKMAFSTDIQEIKKKLGCVDEMKTLLNSHYDLPQNSFFDIIPYFKTIQAPGSFLSTLQLFELLKTLIAMRELDNFINSEKNEDLSLKNIKDALKTVPNFPALEREISRCLDKNGEIKDNASPALFEIRRSMEAVSKSMHKIINRVLQDNIKEGFIEKDTTPSVRDGHIVIPVSSVNRRNISGILHDTSATGKTVFIEPAEVVEAGNRLKELQGEEEQEIIKILMALTDAVRPEIPEIINGCHILALYDFIRGKAKVAIETGGEIPAIENHPEIDWYHAVHPGFLLTLRRQNREVVPLYIKLDQKDRILIISGPNAGGKSVCLKTVGAVQYMLQCGMLPSLHSNSHVGIFKKILIDIGDQQSMENDLSTYSSHLANMKFFLKNADTHTLILADELGSGTEPQIGAALAQSILQKLGESGCFGVVTTHYQNLKIFAENEPGFVNGAMTYDRQHFRPTFQLTIGHPGSSFALDIARNIGLPIEVIENAKEIVGSEYVDSEKFLSDIQRDRKYWKNKRLDIKEKENKLDKLLEEYEDTASELKKRRSEIIKAAKEEAREILSGANRKIEQSISEIRKSQADKEKSKLVRQELEDYKKSLQAEESGKTGSEPIKKLRHKSKKSRQERIVSSQDEKSVSRELQVGDYVKMEAGGIEGQIMSISKDKVEVVFGSLRTSIELSKLKPAKKPIVKLKETIVTSSESGKESRNRQLNFKPEIDVRGMRADEALQAITYFIDDAVQFNSSRVRILHGTGHGILRDVIRKMLGANSAVKSFRDEDVRLGGAGITVVDLD